MRRLLIILLMAATIMGCGKRQKATLSERLVELDSLIGTAPDSAADLLARFPADSMRDGENRAYHALLLTQARYKAYIPATSDSAINIAIAHYNDGGDYDRRIRSLIYKGCVMTELGKPDSAMFWFKRAESVARPDDHANLGYLNYWMGRVYQSQNSDIKTIIKKYHASIGHYTLCNDSSRLLFCLAEMGSVYRNENNDSAIKYFEQAKRLALDRNDTLSFNSCSASEAYAYYLKGDYATSKRLALDALRVGSGLTDSTGAIMVAAMAFARLGMADSAFYFGNQMTLPDDSATQVLYYDMRAQILQARHDQLGYLRNIRMSESIAGDLLSRSLQQQLVDIEKDSALHIAQAKSDKARQQSFFVAVIALLLFLLAGIGFAFWQKKTKLDAARKQNEINLLISDLTKLSRQNDALSDTSQLLLRKVKEADKELALMKDRLDKERMLISNQKKKINEMKKESGLPPTNDETAKKISKSLEYITSLLQHFLKQSNELKPSEFLNEFRTYFHAAPNDAKDGFWGLIRTQVEALYGSAYNELLTKHPNLSDKEIKIICMSALGFSSETMGTCLQHKSNYIDVMKNRLKKKLGIECTIPEYLKQLGEI